MESVLFCIPLKEGCLSKYEAFTKEHTKRKQKYKDMLIRYDIHCAKIWHKNFNGRDYIYVYHEIGPNFREKMKGWDTSIHGFDQWFRKNMMEVYDIQNAAGMEEPRKLVDFIV